MVRTANNAKSAVRKKKSNTKRMTRSEMVKKMLADQNIIRDAVQKGIPLKELQKKYGFKFVSLPSVKN
jgi:hypothetical protein